MTTIGFDGGFPFAANPPVRDISPGAMRQFEVLYDSIWRMLPRVVVYPRTMSLCGVGETLPQVSIYTRPS